MVKNTADRYMKRKHFYASKLNKERFALNKLYSHNRPDPSDTVPDVTNPDNQIRTIQWPK
jgi:hypothetical protein